MPSPVVVNDLVSVSLYFISRIKQQVAVNRVIAKCVSVAGTPTTLDDVAIGYDVQVPQYYLLWMPPTFAAYAGCIVSRFIPAPRTVQTWSKTAAGGGTAAGSLLPTQARVLLTAQTDLAGPRYRGRMYVPFASSGMLATDGSLSSLGKATIQNIALGWGIGQVITNAGGGGSVIMSHGVYSKGIVFTPWTFLTWENAWATQRKSGDYGQLNRLPSFLNN